MARINIENSLYQDIRFYELIQKSGSVETALGIMVRAWTVAQEYWKKGKRPIPKEAYAKQRLSPLIVACGLARIVEDEAIYICGSEEQFAWLIQKQDAGRKGGLKSLRKNSSAAKRSLTEASAAKPPSPSPSPSPAQSPKTGESRRKAIEPNGSHSAEAEPSLLHGLVEVWNQHCGTLPKAMPANPSSKAGKKRLQRIRERIDENPGAEFWIDLVKKVAASDFCNGRTGGHWRANFDWLLQPDTHLKILEGNYSNAKPHQKPLEFFLNDDAHSKTE